MVAGWSHPQAPLRIPIPSTPGPRETDKEWAADRDTGSGGQWRSSRTRALPSIFHVHSSYSLLEGALADRRARQGLALADRQPALALTEHEQPLRSAGILSRSCGVGPSSRSRACRITTCFRRRPDSGATKRQGPRPKPRRGSRNSCRRPRARRDNRNLMRLVTPWLISNVAATAAAPRFSTRRASARHAEGGSGSQRAVLRTGRSTAPTPRDGRSSPRRGSRRWRASTATGSTSRSSATAWRRSGPSRPR